MIVFVYFVRHLDRIVSSDVSLNEILLNSMCLF